MVANIKTYDVILSGRVQGVGFRYFAESVASKYEIKGFVRNTRDNKVNIVCQGEEEEINMFLAEIKKGPAFSVVTDIKVMELQYSNKYNNFEIKY